MVDNELPHLLLRFCQEIARGMEFLSGKSFVHRDLAARNVLFGSDFTCKVSNSRNLMSPGFYTYVAGMEKSQ